MIKIPPYLKPGDTVGITCPAGFMPLENVTHCVETLHSWGYKTIVGKTVGVDSGNYFSAPDKERLEELQMMLDDENINAILFGRGGYGMGRIIDDINFDKFKANPKWLIGYSDITILHCHLHANLKIASLHAPMASAFSESEGRTYIRNIKNVLEGARVEYHSDPHIYNVKGEVTGRLIGGNLALLAHVIGTPSDYSTKDKILFIEDVGEYIYSIDRLLFQLKRSGKLNNIAGLIIGSFTDTKDTDRPFGLTVPEVINQFSKEIGCPVCFNFPVGHTYKNAALKIGGRYKLTVENDGSKLLNVGPVLS
ncbi:MAG: LD-carboxypeptidase [Ferruginibacter sp.]